MSSIVELRKQELAAQINELMNGIEQVISTYSQYGRLEEELRVARGELDRIRSWFNPEVNDPKAFERCIDEIRDLQRQTEQIRASGEAEKRRRNRNAISERYAGTWALILAIIGGLVLTCGGYSSCMANDPGPFGTKNGIPLYNVITGLLVGTIGGAAIGALLGALAGQMEERQSGDSTSGIWLSIGGLATLGLLIFGVASSNTNTRSVVAPPVANQSGSQESRFVVVSECDTPCRMEVGYTNIINTGRKPYLAKFKGKKKWVTLNGDPSTAFPPGTFSPGLAEFVSPQNTPPVRVQILRAR
jgi:hypothetical protein